MLNKNLLKEMFDFTTNKKITTRIGINIIIESLPYAIFYQYILAKVIDKYIPDKNLELVVVFSSILIFIIVLVFFFDK